MIKKFLYKRYLKGKCKIVVQMDPDHSADYRDIGHITNIEFRSGNTYRCKFCKAEYDYNTHLYRGWYVLTNDIQPLTFEQFSQFSNDCIMKNE